MLTSYLVGLTAMAVLVAAWLMVQVAWRRTFPDGSTDPDALADRMGCGGCGQAERCERTETTVPREETS